MTPPVWTVVVVHQRVPELATGAVLHAMPDRCRPSEDGERVTRLDTTDAATPADMRDHVSVDGDIRSPQPWQPSYRVIVSTFDAEATVARVAGYFDRLAAGEWDRHDAGPAAQVAFELHRRMLHRHIRPGMRVLEVGAGPRRFTRELGAAGARITRNHPRGLADVVEGWVRCDIRNVSRWRRGQFDAVVAFGGPISYTFEQAEQVTAGLVALLEPGGVLLASVMSRLDSWRIFLPSIVAFVESGQASVEQMHAV